MSLSVEVAQSRHVPAARPIVPGSLLSAVRGRFRRIKSAVAVGLIGLYAVMPWLRYDRGENLPGQAILIDPAQSRAFVFGLEFWPQDLPLLVGLMVAAASGLFCATTLGGRVWCGFTCPQTVWTDLFHGVDRLTARLAGGGRAVAPLRHGIRIAIAVATAFLFAAYFNDAVRLPGALLSGQAPAGAYLCIGVLTLTTWLFAAYAQERICLHMCPWPRFQAALLDRDSLVVTYQAWRGEPRGRKRQPLRTDLADAPALPASPGQRGDCIDCTRCVTVCPTGVDIRQGLQMGCIGCGLCIDACDDVMTRIGRPLGLIRFDHDPADRTTAPAIESRAPVNLLRPKAVLFGGVCAATLCAVAFGAATMPDLRMNLEAVRSPAYVRLSDGGVRHDFELSLAHRRKHLRAVSLRVEGLPAASLRIADGPHDGPVLLSLRADRGAEARLLLTVPREAVEPGRRSVTFHVTDERTGEELAAVTRTIWGPPS